MYPFTRTFLYVSLFSPSLTTAFQFPFPKSTQTILTEEQIVNAPPRIAIIGAGAAGSSAAFWVSMAKQRSELDVQVDVYERASYIGGRSTTVYPYDDPTYKPLELGASIFVDANKNLMRASKEFNLSLSDFGDEFSNTGILVLDRFGSVRFSRDFTERWTK